MNEVPDPLLVPLDEGPEGALVPVLKAPDEIIVAFFPRQGTEVCVNDRAIHGLRLLLST